LVEVDVACAALLGQAVAELVNRLSDGLVLRAAEMRRALSLGVAVDALVALEQLRQVLRPSVSNRPFEVFNRFHNLLFLAIFVGRRGLFFLVFVSFFLGLFFNDLRLREFFELVVDELNFLLSELKANNCLDLADLLLNQEEFIHITELELLFSVAQFS